MNNQVKYYKWFCIFAEEVKHWKLFFLEEVGEGMFVFAEDFLGLDFSYVRRKLKGWIIHTVYMYMMYVYLQKKLQMVYSNLHEKEKLETDCPHLQKTESDSSFMC